MASEANKIRAQCARKYGVREKAYKERIEALQGELAAANDKLKDYDDMKLAYMKMLVYCGLSDDDKARVLHSQELNDVIDRYAGFLGIAGSKRLQELAHQVFDKSGVLSITELIKVIEAQGL